MLLHLPAIHLSIVDCSTSSANEPTTPVRDHRSPAKNYPTPEPSANLYQEETVFRKARHAWGSGLLSNPKRSRCPKASTVCITVLLLLAVLLLGLTIGHFVTPYVRTLVRPSHHSPSRHVRMPLRNEVLHVSLLRLLSLATPATCWASLYASVNLSSPVTPLH